MDLLRQCAAAIPDPSPEDLERRVQQEMDVLMAKSAAETMQKHGSYKVIPRLRSRVRQMRDLWMSVVVIVCCIANLHCMYRSRHRVPHPV